MKTGILLVFAILLFCGPYSVGATPDDETHLAHVAWVAQSIHEMKSIKVGMTRRELRKIFNEGGINRRNKGLYVYNKCPYMRVEVEFEAVGPADDKLNSLMGTQDKIVKISKPFLDNVERL